MLILNQLIINRCNFQTGMLLPNYLNVNLLLSSERGNSQNTDI